MRILKFGGTSVGTPERMQEVAAIIKDQQGVLVVLSAISGTTNRLVQLIEHLQSGKITRASILIDLIYSDALIFSKALLSNLKLRNSMNTFLKEVHTELLGVLEENTIQHQDTANKILSKGELISTHFFSCLLEQSGIANRIIPALDFMYLNEDGEPDNEKIQSHLNSLIATSDPSTLLITQGYICKTARGQVSNLKRGGSDYSAAIIGAAVDADEIQIWTDIDGMHNNDPRYVSGTHPIPELSYQEAAELAYFGAKILHPGTVHPARQAGIPIRIKNTMNPDAEGTLIHDNSTASGVRAIAAKDHITAIRICSDRMLMAYGFLQAVFEVFAKYKTPIDMITTSEVAVSLTIDDTTSLDAICDELKKFGTVEIQTDQVIICIAGNFPVKSSGQAAEVLLSLKDIPLRMVSYGGSEHNISILVEKEFKVYALRSLQASLFHSVYV